MTTMCPSPLTARQRKHCARALSSVPMTATEIRSIDAQLRLTAVAKDAAIGIIDNAYDAISEELIHIAMAEDRLDLLLDRRTEAS